jgi:YggT family protein
VIFLLVSRLLVAAAFVLASIIALTNWAVRAGRLQPFGAWPRLLRRLSDPLIKPLERRIVRSGGNPQQAPLWLVGITVVGGLMLLAGVEWLIGTSYSLASAAHGGPRGLLRFVVDLLFSLLTAAILVRVIASWFGVSPYARWMRPVLALTDWIVEPLRRIVPPLGMIDFSPMVAYLILLVARMILLRWL